MVTSDRMHTRKLARNTKVGLTSCRAFILVTVGMRVAVSSPATVVGSVSVASADIVALAAAGEVNFLPRLRLGPLQVRFLS